MRTTIYLVAVLAAPLLSAADAFADGPTISEGSAPTSADGAADKLGAAPISPSFDCKKARYEFEIAICENPYLAKMDQAIDRLYRGLPENGAARREHLVWNSLRKDCGSDAGCIFDLQQRSLRAMDNGTKLEPWLRDARRQFSQSGYNHGWKARLPMTIGGCTHTSFVAISDRFGGDPSASDASGTAALFKNGGYVVTYESDTVLIASRVNDPVEMCLVSIPTDCPPDDDRGRVYSITNLRTHGRTKLPDSQHACGGA
jgi:uncharacterized protein